MKSNSVFYSLLSGAVLLLGAVSGSRAGTITNIMTVNLTMSGQGATNDVSGAAVIAPPTRTPLGTKQILAYLAEDENAAGLYSGTSFPEGAQLAFTSVSNVVTDFWVVSKSLAPLVDVTNIIGVVPGSNFVFSGKITSSKYYEPSLHVYRLTEFLYDDSKITNGAGLQFHLFGTETKTVTDGAIKNPGTVPVYTQTEIRVLPVAAGEGVLKGAQFELSGSISSKGRALIDGD